jgi:type I restriction enzyme, S subunit
MSETTEYQLADIFPVSMSGEWGSDPFDNGNALVLRAADFTKDCKLRAVIGAPRNIPQFKLGSRVLKDGDILIEKSGGSPDQPVGRVAFFDRGREKEIYIHSNFLQLLRVAEGFDKKFSYYLMAFLYASGLVLRYQQQTTGIINLKLENYLKEKVSVPSESVQRRIQEILSTIDRTITHTEALIEKYQQIKAGLMHDLFTRGIRADGQLRPPREQAPELYWESAIGWIPKEWEAKKLIELVHFQRGHDIVEAKFIEGDYPVISSGGIIGFHNEFTSKGPSVVIGRKGTIGKVHYIDCDFWAHDTSLFATNLFDNEPLFIYYLCNYLNLAKYGTKSGSPSLNRNDIHPLSIGRPSPIEQKNIVTRLNACTDKISSLSNEYIKLNKQKSGLMHDLLTGKVKVTIQEAT